MPDFGLLDPLAQRSRAVELTDDVAWLQAMVDVEIALTLTLVDTGLAPEWMTDVCAGLADASRLDRAAIAAAGRGGGNPVIGLVSRLRALAEEIHPGASDHLHVGATSQDILDSAAMLIAAGVRADVLASLRALSVALAALVGEHRSTVLAGRTLGQQASPTTFGLVAAGWLSATSRVIDTLSRVELPLQYGGAVGTLEVLTDVVAERLPGADGARPGAGRPGASASTAGAVAEVSGGFARRLGLAFPDLPWHTNRLPIVEFATALASAVAVAGVIATGVLALARTEVAELGERLAEGEGGSSAMPHKRNPVTAVLIAAAAKQTPALLSTLYGSMLAEDQRPGGAWHAEWAPLRDLERHAISAIAAAADLVSRLDVDAERMSANLELTAGLVSSEKVSTILAASLGRDAAFALVERASREAFETGRPLRVVLSGLLSLDGRDEALRTRIWAAFEVSAPVGASDAAIDRVLDRHRLLSEGTS